MGPIINYDQDKERRIREGEKFFEKLADAAQRQVRSLMRHRDRYLKAWVAQTGIRPSEAELCEQVTDNGTRVWARRRQDGEELERLQAENERLKSYSDDLEEHLGNVETELEQARARIKVLESGSYGEMDRSTRKFARTVRAIQAEPGTHVKKDWVLGLLGVK